MRLGEHCIKAWSSNQSVIALSSGEAEFYGIVKGASNALGVAGVLRDLGVNLSVAISTDSSAAKGIANRRGFGKVGHIELSELWVQDLIARGRRQWANKYEYCELVCKHAWGRSSRAATL